MHRKGQCTSCTRIFISFYFHIFVLFYFLLLSLYLFIFNFYIILFLILSSFYCFIFYLCIILFFHLYIIIIIIFFFFMYFCWLWVCCFNCLLFEGIDTSPYQLSQLRNEQRNWNNSNSVCVPLPCDWTTGDECSIGAECRIVNKYMHSSFLSILVNVFLPFSLRDPLYLVLGFFFSVYFYLLVYYYYYFFLCVHTYSTLSFVNS